MKRRRRVVDWEPLEQRALLIGFYEGPAPVPVQVSLQGSALASAVVRPPNGTTYNVSAVARIAPLGQTSISGTVRIVGDVEQGTLTLNSARNRITLHFSGAIPSGPAPTYGKFFFQIVDGKANPPNTTFAYVREQGEGTVQTLIAPGPKPGRASIAFVFSNP